MYLYDISKYMSRSRTNRLLSIPEWSSICDIGKSFNGIELTIDDYIAVEDAYVDTVILITNYMGIKNVTIKDLYKCGEFPPKKEVSYYSLCTEPLRKTYYQINDNMSIKTNTDTFSNLIRLNLREDIYTFFYVPYRFKLCICYDYLMTVRSSVRLEPIFSDIQKKGINIFNA